MKAAARPAWRPGRAGPGRGRAGRPGPGRRPARNGRARGRGRTRGWAWRGAGRRRVASRPIRRRGGDGARAGRGRRRNGRARAARPNAGVGMARGGPTPRGIEADPAGREPRNAGGPGPTPERAGRRPARRGGTLLSPHPPETNSRGRRTPPTYSWGVRRPRGGTDADPSGPGWALGAHRPPAGRMTRAGRLRASPASGAVAGRTAAGGLSSGTGAHLGRGPSGRGLSSCPSVLACVYASLAGSDPR